MVKKIGANGAEKLGEIKINKSPFKILQTGSFWEEE